MEGELSSDSMIVPTGFSLVPPATRSPDDSTPYSGDLSFSDCDRCGQQVLTFPTEDVVLCIFCRQYDDWEPMD